MIGKQVGGYQIVSLLGSGGMGEVYLARDTKLGRNVAIKVLPSFVANDPDRLARFGREARLLAALNHPNIATIHGIEEADGVHGLVMELVEGPTLSDRVDGHVATQCRRQGCRSPKLCASAARSRRHSTPLTREDVIHRDLKPANIKLTRDGQRQDPRLRPGEVVRRTMALVTTAQTCRRSRPVSHGTRSWERRRT